MSRLNTPPPLAGEESCPDQDSHPSQSIQDVTGALQPQPEDSVRARQLSNSSAAPKRKKSVRFDPLSWFRKSEPESLNLSTTSRKTSSDSSVNVARSRPRELERSLSLSSSSSSSPMKFTRHRPTASRRQSRQSSLHSIPEEPSRSQSPASVTASDLDDREGKNRRSDTSTTPISLAQLHQAAFQDDDRSPSGSSSSSDSFERASLCWEASVGPKRASSAALPSGKDREAGD